MSASASRIRCWSCRRAASMSAPSTAYGSQRQPSRWSGSRTGRPPVKMAARPVVTWSKRAGSSPSTSTAPAAQLPARPMLTSPSGSVRVSGASVRRVPSTKAMRRGRSAAVGRCATNAPASSTSSHSTACGESSDAWKPARRWRRRPRRRWCRSGLPGQWALHPPQVGMRVGGSRHLRAYDDAVTDHDTETADPYPHLLTTRLERRPGRVVVAATCRPGDTPSAAELAGPIRMLVHGVRVASAAAAAVPGAAGPEASRPTSTSSPRSSGARAAPAASWPASSPRVASAGGVETEASNQAGTAAGTDVEPVRRGHRCSAGGSTSRPPSPVRTRSRRRQMARRPLGAEDLHRARETRWLLSIPDAISQLEQLDRPLLTRRDIERLFGVGKVRAAALMKTFGAELVGNRGPCRGRSSCSSSRSTGGGPRSASRRRDARAWPPSFSRPG